MQRSDTPFRCLILLTIGLGAAGCDLPRDPEGTLERVQGGRLRAGLVERPPWVVRTAGEPKGAEVELVRRFAAELGATPEWFWGSEEQHAEALAHFELDLLVGGLTSETPWDDRVGLTRSYFKDRVVVGVPSGTPPDADPHGIKGMQVWVKDGDAAVAYLKKKGAVPVPVADLRRAEGAVAAPDWHLEPLGLRPMAVELQSRKHVMAVPPGENGWVKRLEEFLERQHDTIPGLLQQEVAGP